MVVVTAGVLGIVGCGGDDDDGASAAPPETTTTTEQPPSTPVPVDPGACRAASEGDVNAIDLSMTQLATTVDQAFTATEGQYRYVAGNLYEPDGALIPGASVWAFDGDVLFAVSDNAATHSVFYPPDRPAITNWADGQAVAALQVCVAEATA